MLVLSRKVGEEIVIANQVRIRVSGIEGKRVKLAISAPDDISVFRGEIQRRRCAFTPEHELLVSIGE
ncbi:MAG TPA: carbon storage regulator [Pirellulaceae bacterium]|nr:carbon storage regulator [Pirellulaceae bacterium]